MRVSNAFAPSLVGDARGGCVEVTTPASAAPAADKSRGRGVDDKSSPDVKCPCKSPIPISAQPVVDGLELTPTPAPPLIALSPRPP
mmetsp:Transcript_3617/g.7824  ORF Transcript_3617/g.7824 Transcript_3617/m.7824 type:complete len:86 (+) Transcript_3617:393-650(+)